jgi:sulfur carrier protein ThiS
MAKTITIRLAQLAQNMRTITVSQGSTVKELFDKARIVAEGNIYVNGKRAGMQTTLRQGDIVGIVGEVEGGK